MVQSHPSPLSFLGWFSLNSGFAWDFGLVFLALLSGFLAPTNITVCFRWATLYLASYLAPITVVWKRCYGFITTCRGTGHEVKTWNRALGLGKRCETSTMHSSARERLLALAACWRLLASFSVVPDLRRTSELEARFEGTDRSALVNFAGVGTRSFCSLLVCFPLCGRWRQVQRGLCAHFPTNLHNLVPQSLSRPWQLAWRCRAVTPAAGDACSPLPALSKEPSLKH